MTAKTAAAGHTAKHVTKSKASKSTAKHSPAKTKKPATGAKGTPVHAAAKPAKPAKARAFAVGDLLPVCAFEAAAASLRLAGGAVSDEDVAELSWLAGGGEIAPASILAALEAASAFGLAGCRPIFAEFGHAQPKCHPSVLAAQERVPEFAPAYVDITATQDFPNGQQQEVGDGHAERQRHGEQVIGRELAYAGSLPGTLGGRVDGLRPVSAEVGLKPDRGLLLRQAECLADAGQVITDDSVSGLADFLRVHAHAVILGIDHPGPHAVLATADGWWSWGELWSPWPARVEEAWLIGWTGEKSARRLSPLVRLPGAESGQRGWPVHSLAGDAP